MNDKFGKLNSSFKRNKELKNNANYVEPIEMAIGLKWHTKQNVNTNLPDYTIKQLTFQYIPILGTLKCLFANPEFKKEYFDFNSNKNHICKKGVYKYFCCSDNSCELYKDKTSIKLRLAVDDCDVCDPCKSKRVIHKMNCYYFTIDNMSEKYLSKIGNLHLVSLCETSNTKEDGNTSDEIVRVIVNELKQLEKVGIEVDGKTVKGSMPRFVSDNLGANGTIGLVESFNSYFCRLCEISKHESETLIREREEIMRTKESYQKCVETAENLLQEGNKIDFKATKGVKRNCIFNELQNFHFLDNPTLDVMHDVNEGLIPFYLTCLFDYCNSNNIIKKSDIVRLVRDYTYGVLHKQNKPSTINFACSNLGQNATQLYFIMKHLPFIFYEYREQLKNVWESAESLLNIMRIVYSTEICEDDIHQLTTYIEEHYTCLIRIFHKKLLPKHHNVLHYPNAIRKMGPLIHSWMMRFEAKHQFFTNAAQRTNSFVNIAKTLAKKHQEAVCYNNFVKDRLDLSKSYTNFNKYERYEDFSGKVAEFIGHEAHDKLKILVFAKYNSIEYRKGLMIMSGDGLFGIILVFSNEGKISFFCIPYNVNRFESFFNSLEIERKSNNVSDFTLIDLDSLDNPKSYERKVSDGDKSFIICDTLDFKKFM